MENKKMCVWKRGGYFFIATLLGAGPFSSHVYAGTDHDQFNSVVTELNYGLNQKKGKKVTGTIIDETGEPVIGANVVQKGTTNGSITDIDGRFSFGNSGRCYSGNILYRLSDPVYSGEE